MKNIAALALIAVTLLASGVCAAMLAIYDVQGVHRIAGFVGVILGPVGLVVALYDPRHRLPWLNRPR